MKKKEESLKHYQEKIQKYFTDEYPRDLQWSRKLGVKDGFFKGIIIGITTGIVFSSYIIDAYCALGASCQSWFYINTLNLIILIIVNPLLITVWTIFMPKELQDPKIKTSNEPILITFFAILLSYIAYFLYVFAITKR
jgi:CBS domain containing-hemolysin-like protein